MWGFFSSLFAPFPTSKKRVIQVFASGPNSFYNKSVKKAATVCFVVPVKITRGIIWIFILGSLFFPTLELIVWALKDLRFAKRAEQSNVYSLFLKSMNPMNRGWANSDLMWHMQLLGTIMLITESLKTCLFSLFFCFVLFCLFVCFGVMALLINMCVDHYFAQNSTEFWSRTRGLSPAVCHCRDSLSLLSACPGFIGHTHHSIMKNWNSWGYINETCC